MIINLRVILKIRPALHFASIGAPRLKIVSYLPVARQVQALVGHWRAKDSHAPFNYQYEFAEICAEELNGLYQEENKSVTAPRLLLETRWRYFARTPDV